MEPSTSPSGSLNITDIKKVAIGAAIAVAGATVAIVADAFTPIVKELHYAVTVNGITFDLAQPVAFIAFSTLINLARKWLANYAPAQTLGHAIAKRLK